MSKAVAYVRFSCSKQEDGYSIEYQQDKCEAYASLKDIELTGIYSDEGISGKSMKRRSGLKDALDALGKDGVDTLVCYSISRLTRNMADLCFLVNAYFGKGGYNLVCVNEGIDTSTASGRLVLHMLGAVMQNEVETLSERVKASIETRRKQNKKVSRHAPFGFRVSKRTGQLVADLKERRAYAQAHEMRRDGLKPREISEALASKRVRNRRGRPYSRASVVQMLKREPQWAEEYLMSVVTEW